MNLDPRPTLTVLVFAYNQAKTIEKTIQSVLAQTYDPLEVILSDDGSPDDTFAIMQRMAQNYSGPKSIVLNCNTPNKGVVGHINHIFPQAKGELIIIAEGDDSSSPDRVEKLYQSYIAAQKPYLIWSDVIDTNLEGKTKKYQRDDRAERHKLFNSLDLAQVALEKNPCVGASCAYRPEVMSAFGPLTHPKAFPDKALYFRARLLGGVGFCPERLLYYRRGGGISTAHKREAKTQGQIDSRVLAQWAGLLQRKADCANYAPQRTDVLAAIDQELSRLDRKYGLQGVVGISNT